MTLKQAPDILNDQQCFLSYQVKGNKTDFDELKQSSILINQIWGTRYFDSRTFHRELTWSEMKIQILLTRIYN